MRGGYPAEDRDPRNCPAGAVPLEIVPVSVDREMRVMSDVSSLSEAKRALFLKLSRGEEDKSHHGPPPVSRRGPGTAAPLSYGQQQMWLLDQLLPEAPVYTECITVRMPGPLEPAVLERAFNEIMGRHEAWRTTFPTIDGQPIVLVHPPSPVALPVQDLRHLSEETRIPAAIRYAAKDIEEPFDLAAGPLLRPRLVRLGDQEHWLFLTLHHIIFDGFSIHEIFLPELDTLYAACRDGKPSPLPDLPVQYGDFAHWQRQWLREDVLTEQLGYWRIQLAGAPAILQLPSDRPRPVRQTYRGAMNPFALRPGLTDQLKRLSRTEGVTLYMTLLAALNVLLFRYTGQEDIVVGSVSAGRQRTETQGMLGFFLNMLVMRTSLVDDPSFRELLARVRDVVLGALAHGNVPFDLLVKELQPERDSRRNPLFQVALTLEPPLTGRESGWTLTQMEIETHTAKLDLTLEIDDRPNGEGIIGRFEYNTDLFDAATISRMCDHWQVLLEGIVADPACPVSALPLLTELEHRQLVVEWNDTAASYTADRCIHQLFEEQAARTPNATAVVFEDQFLTYAELNRRANQLAQRLIHLGVGPEHLVGLCVERSLEMMVGMLGILKAGGAYIPLDPHYPRERLAFMLEDAQVVALVTQTGVRGALPHTQVPVILLDNCDSSLIQERSANPPILGSADDLAYVIYTSGSTGKPKGVLISHRALCNFLHSMQLEPGLSPTDILVAVTSLSFDIAGLEMYLPILVGAQVVIAGHDVVGDGEALATLLRRSAATFMQATPTTWRILLAAGWAGQPGLTMLCGGEAIPFDLAQALLPRGAALWNLYGPTETTIWSMICRLYTHDERVRIGRPIGNTQVFILDQTRRLLPIGVPGELYIGGAGLARGYLHRAELTAERFVPHPFSNEPGTRLYRTGDLARYLPDGSIECLGRLDNQIKIRGFRIELGEIEAALRVLSPVRDAVVISREDSSGAGSLIAYVLMDQGRPPAIPSLRAALREQLPEYMVPAVFVPLEAFPLTPNGKVDRHALPMPLPEEKSAVGYVMPTVMLHYQLTWIWEELLKVRPIGITDNFFELGGHSLLAARMVDRIEQACGKRIPLATLFTEPTIEHLTRVLLSQEGDASEPRVTALNAGGQKHPFFFLHGDWMGGGLYTVALARKLGAEQPFYVLTPFGVGGNKRIPRTIEAMASAQLKEIRAVQPRGPYILGGFCMSGVIALEMARQLQASGERVNLLVLLDTYPSPWRQRMRQAIDGAGQLAGLDAETTLGFYLGLCAYDERREVFQALDRGEQLRLALNHIGNGREWIISRLIGEAGARKDRVKRQRSPTRLPRDLPGITRWIAAGYKPRRYSGRIAHFWADEEYRKHKSSIHKVWQAIAPKSEFHVIPGAHLTVITTYRDQLATAIALCVEAAQSS